ncbi:MAG: YgjV family protein [Clostridia bacterium]|nr:YgjV family protein [Clostridia bacterium]
MNDIIAGNVCSLAAMITDSISGTRKKRTQILGIQIISQFFYAAGSMILKGYSSTAQNAVAILRNLAGMKNIKSKAVEWILISLGVALGIIFNNRGLLGWLPIVANFIYSVAIFRFKDNEKSLKIVFIINLLMYTVFSAVIQNYVGAVANTVVAVITAISLIKGAKNKETE